jgi:ribosomal protein S8
MIRSHIKNAMICIKNRNCGRISIYKTKENLQLLKILEENNIINYEHVCKKILNKENLLKSCKQLKGSDYKLELNITRNFIESCKFVSPVKYIGWKDLKDYFGLSGIRREVILRTNVGLLTSKEAIAKEVGGIILIQLDINYCK